MTVSPTARTLSSVLEQVESLPWDFALYLPKQPWGLETPALILDPDDCEDDQEEPAEARARGFRYALGVQDVKGVVENARQQRPAIDTPGLLQAMQYYYDHDAYAAL